MPPFRGTVQVNHIALALHGHLVTVILLGRTTWVNTTLVRVGNTEVTHRSTHSLGQSREKCKLLLIGTLPQFWEVCAHFIR